MPIPAFTNDGILPPFLGMEPGEASYLMSPHKASVAEVVNCLATSDNRKTILIGWLLYRQALRRAGLRRGFQWIDGSFVENKEPKDIDIGLFYRRPTNRQNDAAFKKFAENNQKLLRRELVKAKSLSE